MMETSPENCPVPGVSALGCPGILIMNTSSVQGLRQHVLGITCPLEPGRLAGVKDAFSAAFHPKCQDSPLHVPGITLDSSLPSLHPCIQVRSTPSPKSMSALSPLHPSSCQHPASGHQHFLPGLIQWLPIFLSSGILYPPAKATVLRHKSDLLCKSST